MNIMDALRQVTSALKNWVSEQISTVTADFVTQEYVDNKSPKTLLGTEDNPVIITDLDVGIYEIPDGNYYKDYSSNTSCWGTTGTTLIVATACMIFIYILMTQIINIMCLEANIFPQTKEKIVMVG